MLEVVRKANLIYYCCHDKCRNIAQSWST